jgi:hypothetical protein
MKRLIFLLAVLIVGYQVMAIDAYSIREIRDPVKFKARLDADMATLAAGVGVAAVTNASLTLSTAAITATAAVATWTTNIITYLDATTNAVASTNIIPATISVTVVNGGVVCTNVAITLQTN